MSTSELVDRPTEVWLADFPGIRNVDLRSVDLAEIDVKRSLSNQARIEPLDSELAAKYQRAVEGGALFPPLVISSEMVILDGNHRFHAMKEAGVTSHPCYVIDAPAAVSHLLAMSANVRNGQPNTPKEVALHAIQMHDSGALSFRQIGSALGMNEGTVSEIVRAENARRRINRPTLTKKLPRSVLTPLDGIQSDDHLVAAARVAVDAQMSGKQAKQLVAEVKKARTDTAARDAIDAVGKKAQVLHRDKGKPKAAAKTEDFGRFKRGAGLVLSVNPTSLAFGLNGSTGDVVGVLDEMTTKIAEIRKAVAG